MHENTLSLVPESTGLEDIIATANSLIQCARSAASTAAYESDFQHFSHWAEKHGLEALPASGATVALYAAAFSSSLKPATIARRLAAINTTHKARGYTHNPASCRNTPLGEVMRGIRRSCGTAQHSKDPLLTCHVKKILLACPDSLSGLRDRALLGISFSGAFRRAETASLLTTDLELSEAGLTIHLRRSKTDPFGAGRDIGIPWSEDESVCPVRALKRWIDAARITGPLFRSVDRWGRISAGGLGKDSIGRIVRKAAERAGIDSHNLSGHSLRSGHVTSAKLYGGASDEVIMRQTGHKTAAMVRRYTKMATVFTQNSAAALGL